MPLQSLLLVPVRVEDVDLRIIQRNHDVLRRKMQTRDHALILRDMPRNMLPARLPSRLHQVPLFEVTLVRPDLRSPQRSTTGRTIKTP